MDTDLIAAGVVVVILVTDVFFTAYLLRVERESAQVELDRLEKLHAGERERLAKRVEYLEFQLAASVARALKLPPPAPPVPEAPPLKPLPEVMQKFLDAIDDEESRQEFESDFRARLEYPNADPAGIVAAALNAGA